MSDRRKPFFSIADEVDDSALEAIARRKGVPAMTRGGGSAEPGDEPAPGQGTMTALMMPAPPANDPMHTGPTPRARMSYVKACLPDYALAELKTRAVRERVCINHILLKALDLYGIAIRPEDMIEDGRRLRGRNGVLP